MWITERMPNPQNLKPPWQPGQSGNPKGRPTAGASVREWVNLMAEWTVDRIREVATEVGAPAAKVAAARVWLDAASDQRNAAGSPIAGPEFDRIMDRTEGKPKQSVQLSNDTGPRTYEDRVAAADSIVAELLEVLGGGRELPSQGAESLAPVAH